MDSWVSLGPTRYNINADQGQIIPSAIQSPTVVTYSTSTGLPKKATIQIQISALIQTYCSALKLLSFLNKECVKTHSFIHMGHEEKLVIIHETASIEIEFNNLCELTR